MRKYIGVLLHGFAYYVSWVACIYFAQKGAPWTGPFIVLLALFLQAFWEKMNGFDVRRQLLFTLYFGLLGMVVDTLWLVAHLIDYKANPWVPYLAAPWIISLWLSFGFYLIALYEKTFPYYKTWGFLALLGVPFAYWLGVKMGTAVVLNPYFYLILGCFWAIALPLFLCVYRLSPAQYLEILKKKISR